MIQFKKPSVQYVFDVVMFYGEERIQGFTCSFDTWEQAEKWLTETSTRHENEIRPVLRLRVECLDVQDWVRLR